MTKDIIKNVDYDFSNIEDYLGEWRGLGFRFVISF